jgi:hypothetical protein
VIDLAPLEATVEVWRDLAEWAGDCELLAMQYGSRLRAAEAALEDARKQPGAFSRKPVRPPPGVAIHLRDPAEWNAEGVRASLAVAALASFEGMYVAQALHDDRAEARAAARRGSRLPPAAPPALCLVGSGCGPSGMEFRPAASEDDAANELRGRSLRTVTEAVVRAVRQPAEPAGGLPRGFAKHLRNLLVAVARGQSGIRFGSVAGPSVRLSPAEVALAAERLVKAAETPATPPRKRL